jgi:acetyltransferase-like isoleucine patch superfamily enzyme
VIGDDVWFGANTTILPGVKIGSGSIIARGAVVTRGKYPLVLFLQEILQKWLKQYLSSL